MSFYKIIRPLIFKLEPEKAHELAIDFLRFFPNLATMFALNKNYKNLNQEIFNLTFKNPIGMAAGFDKNAQMLQALSRFGFGFVEVGTVTPKPQKGNEKPRIFRLKEDQAIINRLGFNNLGADVFENNIDNSLSKVNCAVGINIGKNKDTQNALDDYLPLLERFYQKASYITINISSPNTKNLRDLQKEGQLNLFLSEISKKRDFLQGLNDKKTPILLKIAPDLTILEQEQIAQTVLDNKIDGLIISNTTIDRNFPLKSQFSSQSGGLSGAPLFEKSNEALKNLYKFTNKQVPIIGVGGISNASDIYEKIKCGASLVQIYSAFIYQGFSMVENCKKQLSQMVEKDGFKNVNQAIGVNCS